MTATLPPPPFEIPLSDEELLLMGKIAVIWGQIDEGFNSILRRILRLTPELFESLAGTQMIGSRLKHFKAAISGISAPAPRELADKLYESLSKVGSRRNDAMHGCWGRYPQNNSYSDTRVGTFNHQKPKTRFWIEDLPKLYTDLVEAMKLIEIVSWHLIGADPANIEWDQLRIFFAPAPPSEQSGLYCRRGEKIVHVETIPQGWHFL